MVFADELGKRLLALNAVEPDDRRQKWETRRGTLSVVAELESHAEIVLAKLPHRFLQIVL